MSIRIRLADLEADADQIVKLLAAYINPRYDHARFDWLYRRNPDGVGQAWLAVSTDTGKLIGVAGSIPRRIRIGPHEQTARVLSDFCVADAYRALGPALKLQSACLAPPRDEPIAFSYDFPGAGMMAVYRRLRIEPFARMRRLVYHLRVDAQLESLPVPAFLRRAMTVSANALLGLRAGYQRRQRRLTASLLSGRCGAEFSEFSARHAAGHGVSVNRSADYLNWRFLDNPFQPHEILTVRERGELAAYALLTPDPSLPAIVDLFGPREPDAIIAVASAAITLARARGASSLSMTILESHPWSAALAAAGFRPRETHPVIVHMGPTGSSGPATVSPDHCLLTQGDRDS